MLILFSGTLFFRWNNGAFDKAITNHFYQAELPAGDRFFLAKTQPWLWLKQNDGTFALILTLPLLALLAASYQNPKYRRLKRYAGFGLASVAVGPGLLVNVIFKDYWGRPRPTQTLLWPDSATPDNLPFYKIWEPAFLDGIEKNSFPSGHASIVVAYVVLFYLFKNPEIVAYSFDEFKKWRVFLFTGFKYLGLGISFIGGGLMGFTRIVQGAHFASDVLWSFGMVLLTNWIFYYYIFKIPRWEATPEKASAAKLV
jgi:membrane-associated phospholipid phosphatase